VIGKLDDRLVSDSITLRHIADCGARPSAAASIGLCAATIRMRYERQSGLMTPGAAGGRA
jgi:hypothetical protein